MKKKIFLRHRIDSPQIGTRSVLTIYYPTGPDRSALCEVEESFLDKTRISSRQLPKSTFNRLKTELESLSLPLCPSSLDWLDTPSHDLWINTQDHRIRLSWIDLSPPWKGIQAFLNRIDAELRE